MYFALVTTEFTRLECVQQASVSTQVSYITFARGQHCWVGRLHTIWPHISSYPRADRTMSGVCLFVYSCLCLFVCVCVYMCLHFMPSVLWRCWLGGRKGIWPVKNWVVGYWHGCLGWGADLHIAQQMPLPLTVSCSSKSRLALTFLVFTFLVPAHMGGPGHIPEEQ